MNPYTNLAKTAIKSYLKHGEKIDASNDLPKEMIDKKSGVFVTLESGLQRQLRGCIGTYLPTKDSIAEEIITNAVAAATEDYRFPPVTTTELPDLHFGVSILHEPKQIKTMKDLDVKKYGVIVKSADGRSGLLLPEIDSVDTPEKQVAIAAQKAGIDLDKDQISLFRFSVDKHSDD
ncbi:AmmeMemoRadiSam system protein A [Patescibacteria group bacterium]